MGKDRPETQKSLRALPGRNTGLRACWMLLMGGVLLTAMAWGASSSPSEKPKGTTDKTAAANFVGSETCAGCHDEVSKGFAGNPHEKAAIQHNGVTVTCENCHGAGKEHVEGGGDKSKIFNPAKATTKEVDARCLSCHRGQHSNFERSQHAKANVSCVSCHSVHSGEDKEHLLKTSEPKLCLQCHTETKPQFAMPFHHKVEEGLIKCNDCHDPHGTFQANNLKTTADKNAICTKCHTDTRGPFVFEHPVVKSEGCMACHTPHGSQNARLLNVPNINSLCKQCHSPMAAGNIHGAGQGSSVATSCVDCHTMVHGSNVSQAFIR